MHENIPKTSDYTFKFNKNLGRHGWLRLTPAYSVKLVQNILEGVPKESVILEPFSGTATTGLVCAEAGYACNCFDINPFLIWLGEAKCRSYSDDMLTSSLESFGHIRKKTSLFLDYENWIPPLFNIERWWSKSTLSVLASLRASLVELFGEPQIATNPLPWIAFCRLVIETSSAAFNHVSMSFKTASIDYELEHVLCLYENIFRAILSSSSSTIVGDVSVIKNDSINWESKNIPFDVVITSPPYPNRMSYIRELRPYMYWMKFLTDAREAGELDWQAVGGTWGVATSYLNSWNQTENDLPMSIYETTDRIKKTQGKNADVLSRYVFKYFHDMHKHFKLIARNGNKKININYIIGNSSFYGEIVDAPMIFSDSLAMIGFTDIKSSVIRKRNSNKSLYEYAVTATFLK